MSFRTEFAQDIRSRKVVAGTFVKFNDPAVIEVLGHSGFDFAILDAEHVALGRADVARMAVAARAAQLPLIVRIPEPTGAWIATVLDAGCAGVMVPQVDNAKTARTLARMMRYGMGGMGGMGFSPSTPGAEYGARGLAGHLAQQPEETVLICQIEDLSAAEQAADIAAVEGVDGIFLGPVDLAVAMGSNDPASVEVMDVCRHVIAASATAKKPAGLFLNDLSKSADWEAFGAKIFVFGSDQSFVMNAAKAALMVFRKSE